MLSPSPADAAPQPSPMPAEPGSPCLGRVLLVDDDDQIRQVLAYALLHQGFEVAGVADGCEAVALFEGGSRFDLVVLDVHMPQGGAASTLPRLLDLHPQQDVIITTGYVDRAVEELAHRHSRVTVLAKPFRLEQLMDRLHDVLARP